LRILYLCHRIPYPPDKGEKIRAYHQIVHLARRHEVHLVTFGEHPFDPAYADALRRICATVEVVERPRMAVPRAALLALLLGRSLSVAAYESAAFRAAVIARCRESRPDVVFVYTAVMAPHAERIAAPRLVDFVDVDSEKWKLYGTWMRPPMSVVYAIEGKRLASFEARTAATFERSVLISEVEARLLEARVPGLRVSVISNGVDLDYYRPAQRQDGPASPPTPRAAFVGMMDYFPNCDAAIYFSREILPRIRAVRPDFEFHVVGRQPTAGVRALGRIPGVTVTGAVPDVRPHLAQAMIAVAPFRIARGIQNKVLEAMASGLPVVGTRLAFQGIPAGDQDGVRATDDPESFARSVLDLIGDPSLRATCGTAARAYVERHHRWEDVGAILDADLSSLAIAARGGEAVASKGASR